MDSIGIHYDATQCIVQAPTEEVAPGVAILAVECRRGADQGLELWEMQGGEETATDFGRQALQSTTGLRCRMFSIRNCHGAMLELYQKMLYQWCFLEVQ